MDNDLLTLWLNAGTLGRDTVRQIVTDLQTARDEARDEAAVKREVSALEDDIQDARDRIHDLEDELLKAQEAAQR